MTFNLLFIGNETVNLSPINATLISPLILLYTHSKLSKEAIHSRAPKADFTEDRIARLEMEVELLRNFLILTERGRKYHILEA